MENNKLVGYLLILLLLITYYTYFVPEYEKEVVENSAEKVDEKIKSNETFNSSVTNENILNSINQKDIDVENNDLIITFSILAITDRTYLMFEGSILKHGKPEELASDEIVRKVYLGQNFELRKKSNI